MLEIDKIRIATDIDVAYFNIRMSGNSYSAVIRIRRINEKEIRDIHQTIGFGTVGRGKEYWWYNVTGQSCTNLLIEVLPYMRKKVKHAQIMMEFNMLLKNRKTTGKLSKEEVMSRHNLMVRLQLAGHDRR